MLECQGHPCPHLQPTLPSRLHTHSSSCQSGISTWIPNEHLKRQRFKTESSFSLNLLVLSLIPFSRYHPCVSIIQAKILGTILDLVAMLAFHKPLQLTFAPPVFLDQVLGTVSPLAATVETTSSLPLIHFKSSISSLGPCSTKQPEWFCLNVNQALTILIVTCQRLPHHTQIQ